MSPMLSATSKKAATCVNAILKWSAGWRKTHKKMRIVTLKPVVEEHNDKIMCTFSSWVRQNSRGHSL